MNDHGQVLEQKIADAARTMKHVLVHCGVDENTALSKARRIVETGLLNETRRKVISPETIVRQGPWNASAEEPVLREALLQAKRIRGRRIVQAGPSS